MIGKLWLCRGDLKRFDPAHRIETLDLFKNKESTLRVLPEIYILGPIHSIVLNSI